MAQKQEIKNQEYQEVFRRSSTIRSKKQQTVDRSMSVDSIAKHEFDKEEIEILRRVQNVRQMIEERP